jgi:hypothetical protein
MHFNESRGATCRFKSLSRSHGLRRAVVRLAWSALLILPASVAAVTIRVGAIGDPACTAFSIQGAIAQLPPGLTEHRLLLSSNQTYTTAGVITDRSHLRYRGWLRQLFSGRANTRRAHADRS